MSAQHTPGPWHAQKRSPDTESYVVVRRDRSAPFENDYFYNDMGGIKLFRSFDAAEKQARKLRAAIAKATGSAS